jgi:hypothetical protein
MGIMVRRLTLRLCSSILRLRSSRSPSAQVKAATAQVRRLTKTEPAKGKINPGFIGIQLSLILPKVASVCSYESASEYQVICGCCQ